MAVLAIQNQAPSKGNADKHDPKADRRSYSNKAQISDAPRSEPSQDNAGAKQAERGDQEQVFAFHLRLQRLIKRAAEAGLSVGQQSEKIAQRIGRRVKVNHEDQNANANCGHCAQKHRETGGSLSVTLYSFVPPAPRCSGGL